MNAFANSLIAAAAVTLTMPLARASVPSGVSMAGPYACDGAKVVFSVPFRFLEPGHLVVTRTGIATAAEESLSLKADYTVTGAAAQGGGTVVLKTAGRCPPGYSLTVKRVVPLSQPISFRGAAVYSPAAQEDAVDRLAMVDQQIVRDQEGVTRHKTWCWRRGRLAGTTR